MTFDWLASDTSARQSLYRVTKTIVDRAFMGQWQEFYDAVFGGKFFPAFGYEDNFRAGRISRKRAHVIAAWIAMHYPDDAACLARDIAMADDDGLQFYLDFVEARARDDTLSIIPLHEWGIVGLASASTSAPPQIKLREPFLLALETEGACSAIGFQWADGALYPLPLCGEGKLCATLTSGPNILPFDHVANVPEPLSEDHTRGLITFHVLTAKAMDKLAVASDWPMGEAITRNALHGFLEQIDDTGAMVLHRASVMIV